MKALHIVAKSLAKLPCYLAVVDVSNFLRRESFIMSLAGTKTEQNLKDAFAGESQANRR